MSSAALSSAGLSSSTFDFVRLPNDFDNSGEVNLMARPPYGARTTCESCIRIDVRRWHREGWLSAGQHFTCSSTHSSGKSASINVRTERDAVVLTYRTRGGPATGWKSISQRVPITWTDRATSLVHLFGVQPWSVLWTTGGGSIQPAGLLCVPPLLQAGL
jgi:hypothetical protein